MTVSSSIRRAALRAAVLGTAACAAFGAAAQGAAGWPTKPVTIIVPFPAGGGTDAFARPLSATLTKQLGTTDSDDWPFVNGRFLKPDTIVSVDVEQS